MSVPKPKKGETKAAYQNRLRSDGYTDVAIFSALNDWSSSSSGGYGCASSSSYDGGSSSSDGGGGGGGE
jgi:hypothetical protein